MTFDPTKNDKPCCLMDPADLKALKECGGPWVVLNVRGEWENIARHPAWGASNTYRQKPRPKMWWVRPVQEYWPPSVLEADDIRNQGPRLIPSGYRLMREVE